MKKVGRNDLCPCGSGKKFKKCCITKRVGKTQKGNVISAEELTGLRTVQLMNKTLVERYKK